MPLKESVEQAFGQDAKKRILNFLLEKELAGCGDDTARWLRLFEKCERWRKKFLLWESSTYIDGIHGWNLSMDVCRLRLPEEAEDWTKYLYRMTLLVVVGGMDDSERDVLAECGQKYNNFSLGLWADDYYVVTGYADLTREQWLGEAAGLLEKSWENYQKFPGNNPRFQKDMELNYPKFRAALEYLEQNTENCGAARMNKPDGDETVWYFAKAQDSFYIMRISDAM